MLSIIKHGLTLIKCENTSHLNHVNRHINKLFVVGAAPLQQPTSEVCRLPSRNLRKFCMCKEKLVPSETHQPLKTEYSPQPPPNTYLPSKSEYPVKCPHQRPHAVRQYTTLRYISLHSAPPQTPLSLNSEYTVHYTSLLYFFYTLLHYRPPITK